MVWDRLRSSYDLVAGRYEAAFRDELDVKPRDRELLEAFAESVEDPIADVGCGPGQVGAFVRGRGRMVIGVDFSTEMVKRATKRLDAGLAADLRRLPFGTGQLGGVLAFYSLIHIGREELGAALAEVHRVLRPGGRVLFSVHEGHGQIEQDEFLNERTPFVATLFDLDELVDATEGAGLKVKLAERRPPYPSEHPTVRLSLDAERPTDVP
jgi:SAM-dependent methyltransferase